MNTASIVAIVLLYLGGFYIFSKKALAQLREMNNIMKVFVGEEE